MSANSLSTVPEIEKGAQASAWSARFSSALGKLVGRQPTIAGPKACGDQLPPSTTAPLPATSVAEPSPTLVPDTAPLPREELADDNQDETSGLCQQMLSSGRFALLLRPQVAAELSAEQCQQAWQVLRAMMAEVPAGVVEMERWKCGELSCRRSDARHGAVQVEALYLDRCAVTNRQYQAFVREGGYETEALWDPAIWPEVHEFVNQTGTPGPRFWSDNCFPPGEEDHPVVGVNWYEASAYARWVGKRLPTDAEWVKAAAAPVASSAGVQQRRFPWGNHADTHRANLWGSGSGHTVPVKAFPEGDGMSGLRQLIGNVWEWTTGNFGAWEVQCGELELSYPLKSIRGGSYDTYFENQATSQFQSGERPTARRANIGFRCAIGVADLAPPVVGNAGAAGTAADSASASEHAA